MRFQIPTYTAAVFLTLLAMGAVGLAVVLPIACIQWSWNALTSVFSFLPLINAWQAVLLYLAAATLLYLSGIVRIEFEMDK